MSYFYGTDQTAERPLTEQYNSTFQGAFTWMSSLFAGLSPDIAPHFNLHAPKSNKVASTLGPVGIMSLWSTSCRVRLSIDAILQRLPSATLQSMASLPCMNRGIAKDGDHTEPWPTVEPIQKGLWSSR